MTTTTPAKFTKLGPALFSWRPYLELFELGEDGARAAHLWLVMYCSTQAKLLPPGLWNGGYGTMADASHQSFGHVQRSLAILEERDLVEFDPHHQVLRFVRLPDRCEAATSPGALKSFWSKYAAVNDCGVKRRYLELVAWLHLPIQPSKRSEKAAMVQAWNETFGAAIESLNTSPAQLSSSHSAAPALRSPAPKQLALVLAPTPGDMSRDMSEEGEEAGSDEEGEMQERGCPQPLALAPPPPPAPVPAQPAAPAPAAPAPPAAVTAPDRGYQPPDYLCPPDPVRPVWGPTAHVSDEAPNVVEAHDLWLATTARLDQRMLHRSFDLWIRPLEPMARDGPLLHLRAPNAFHADQFRSSHQHHVEAELRAITGQAMQVAIHVAG